MKKIIVIIMILTLVLSCAAFAEPKTLYANKNIVKVYARQSESKYQNILFKLPYGDYVTSEDNGANENGWIKVVGQSGLMGYCKIDQLTDDNPNILDLELTAKKTAQMRVLPKANVMVLESFSKGEKVKVVAVTPDGKWFRAEGSGEFGYVKADELKPVKKLWYLGEKTDIVTSAGAVEVLSYGESVKIFGVAGNDAVVQTKSGAGYIRNFNADEFSDVNPCKKGKTLYVMADGVRMNSEAVAGTSAYVQYKLKKNAKVTLYGTAPGVKFCRVKYGGKYGYILKNCLSEEKVKGKAVVAADKDINVYKGNNSSVIVGTADKGDELLLLSVKVNRAKVTVKETGVTGWIKITDFK